jgi:uncharacterized protein (DUF362 family)
MTKKISRRSFIKKSAAIGVGSIAAGNIIAGIGSLLPTDASATEDIDVSVVQGKNYFDNTIKAIEQLGGMSKYVPKGSKVAILANAQGNNPGAYTKPQILKAAIQMCKKAGAKEINCITQMPEEAWVSNGSKKVVDEESVKLVLVKFEDVDKFVLQEVPKGVNLKKTRIMKEYYNNDVFINIPICKDHFGNKYTGALKNMMGLNFSEDNGGFHQAQRDRKPNGIRFLDECIADLNTIIKDHLCIVDATEFITTNGPGGPGFIIRPQKVVAGTDRVAIDAYCCSLWGLKGENIIAIKQAYDHKLGEIDLSKVKIKEIKI